MTKVLVVEDEESFLGALRVGLGREGFAIAVARDGREALSISDRAVEIVFDASTSFDPDGDRLQFVRVAGSGTNSAISWPMWLRGAPSMASNSTHRSRHRRGLWPVRDLRGQPRESPGPAQGRLVRGADRKSVV